LFISYPGKTLVGMPPTGDGAETGVSVLLPFPGKNRQYKHPVFTILPIKKLELVKSVMYISSRDGTVQQ